MKAFLVVELIAVLIALVLPVTPGKTGPAIVLPADAASYFQRVLIYFVMANGILLLLAAASWMYWIAHGRPSLASEETTEESSPLA